MEEISFPEPDQPLPDGLFKIGDEVWEFGGPLDEASSLPSSATSAVARVTKPGLYQPNGQPHAEYDLDERALVQLFDNHGVDKSVAQRVGILASTQEVARVSNKLGLPAGAFVNKDGLVLGNDENSLIYTDQAVTLQDITPEKLRLRNKELLHELGHLIWNAQTANEDDKMSLYHQWPLITMMRKAGQISTPLELLGVLANAAQHNIAQGFGCLTLAVIGLVAWTAPRRVLWQLDKEERFARKVARKHRKTQLLKPALPEG